MQVNTVLQTQIPDGLTQLFLIPLIAGIDSPNYVQPCCASGGHELCERLHGHVHPLPVCQPAHVGEPGVAIHFPPKRQRGGGPGDSIVHNLGAAPQARLGRVQDGFTEPAVDQYPGGK